MRRRWPWLVLVLVLAPLLALYLLLATTAGLRLSLQLARHVAPGELQVERLDGRWLGPLELAGFEYRADGQHYRIATLALDWRPGALLRGRLDITRLQIQGVMAELGPAGAMPEPESAPAARAGTPDLSLPLAIRIRELAIREVDIRRGGQPLLQLDALQLAAAGEAGALQLGKLELVLPQGRLQASGAIGLAEQEPTDLTLQWSAQLEPLRTLAGKARLSGDWQRLQLEYALQQPAPLTLQLELEEPFGALRWQARVELPQAALRDFSADWPELLLAAHIEARGDRHQAELQARLRTDAGAGALYPLQLQARLRDQDDGWRLDQARVTQPDSGGELRLAGQGEYGGSSRLSLDWSALRWPPLAAADPVLSPTGQLAWSGTPQAYQLQLDGQVQGGGVPAMEIRLQGQGDAGQLRVERLQVAVLDGEISGQGQLQWAPQLAWQAGLEARRLDPAHLQPDWPGRLAARLRLMGEQRDTGLHQQLVLEALEGELRGYPVAGQGRLTQDGEALRIEQFALRSGSAVLRLDVRLDQHWQGDWQLQIPDLAMLVPAGSGQLQGQGQVRGPREAPRLTLQLQGQDLTAAELALASVQAELDWQAARDGLWQLDLQARELLAGGQRLASLAAQLRGTAQQHALGLQATGDGIDLQLALDGQWQPGQWQGRLQQADWTYPPFGQWVLAQPADLAFGPAGDRVEGLCWQREPGRLCVEGAGDRARGWQLQASLERLPLQWLAVALPPEQGLEGTLEGRLSAHLQPAAGLTAGEFALTLSPGRFRFGEQPEQQLAYGGGEASGRLEQERLQLQWQLALAGEDRFTGSGTISGLGSPAPRLDLRLQGEVRELALVEAFSHEVEAVQGRLELDARVQGTLSRPAPSGSLRLEQGSVTLPAAGLRLEALQLALEARDAAHVAIRGSARSGPEGRLQVQGGLDLPPQQDWQLQLQVQGQQFQVVDIPEYQVRLSPDLRLDAAPQRVRLEGEVLVPYARLRPRDFSGAVQPSPDVVRVGEGEPAAQASPWQIYSDLQLRLGEDVQFSGFGLKGFIDGELALHDEPERLTRARGVLAVREGRYKAYGQELTIETGRVLYNDSPLDNPGLDIKAARHVGDITAGIRVGGLLREPRVDLYSDPPLSETDTLSYLLLGRPVQQASGSEGAALMQAASAAGIGGGGLLAAQIGERFGFDEVELGGGGSLEETALMVGKYLSPRLYVQYSVGLLEPISTFRVRYEMSRRWTLQTETGTESGADVLYTLE